MPQCSMEPTLWHTPPDIIWILRIYATSKELIHWQKRHATAKWLHSAGGHVCRIWFFFTGLRWSAQISVWSSLAEERNWICRKGQISSVMFICGCHTNIVGISLLCTLHMVESLLLIWSAGKSSQTAHWGKAAHPITDTTVKPQLNHRQNKTSKGTVHCRSFLTNRAVYSAFTCPHNLPSLSRLEATSSETQWQAPYEAVGQQWRCHKEL